MHNRNRFEFIGNIASNPEVKTLPDGKRVCNLRIATNETWKDGGGQRQVRTDFHPITVWIPKTIDLVEQYVRKGMYISIEGKITHSKKERGSETVYQTNLEGLRFHFLEPRGDGPDGFGGDDQD